MIPSRILDLRSRGLTLQEIADQIGCGRLEVFRALVKGGAIICAPGGRANVTLRVPQ